MPSGIYDAGVYRVADLLSSGWRHYTRIMTEEGKAALLLKEAGGEPVDPSFLFPYWQALVYLGRGELNLFPHGFGSAVAEAQRALVLVGENKEPLGDIRQALSGKFSKFPAAELGVTDSWKEYMDELARARANNFVRDLKPGGKYRPLPLLEGREQRRGAIPLLEEDAPRGGVGTALALSFYPLSALSEQVDSALSHVAAEDLWHLGATLLHQEAATSFGAVVLLIGAILRDPGFHNSISQAVGLEHWAPLAAAGDVEAVLALYLLSHVGGHDRAGEVLKGLQPDSFLGDSTGNQAALWWLALARHSIFTPSVSSFKQKMRENIGDIKRLERTMIEGGKRQGLQLLNARMASSLRGAAARIGGPGSSTPPFNPESSGGGGPGDSFELKEDTPPDDQGPEEEGLSPDESSAEGVPDFFTWQASGVIGAKSSAMVFALGA